MVGAAFAAVPLYRIFCQATGFGGTTRRADAGADRTLDREVIVRFDANVQACRGRSGRSSAGAREARRDGTGQFIAENHRQDRDRPARATFNVAPDNVGAYFNKIQCFCFTEQTLKPGEQAGDAGAVLRFDPTMANDRDLDATRTITLSYTFFPVARSGRQPVAQADGDATDKSL